MPARYDAGDLQRGEPSARFLMGNVTGRRLIGDLAIVGRMVGGLARAIVDHNRRQELSHRLLEFQLYDRFVGETAAPRKSLAARVADNVPFPLLLTTNNGLYLLDRGGLCCLLAVRCFGVARHGGNIFLGATAGIHSFVLSAEVVGENTVDQLRNVQVLARYETRYQNERIHQIAFDPRTGLVHCANCRGNSLLAVDSRGKGIVDEKVLFADRNGYPLRTDQNHINSVTVDGDALLFTAHTVGEGAGALGFVADDVVRTYRYPARGIHDIVVHDGGIMFTDSFRDGEAAARPNASGAIQFRGEEYLSQSIDAGERKLVLRGLTIRGPTLVVGFSAFAEWRAQRSADRGGGIIVFRDEKLIGIVEGPFGQVHDVLPADGMRTDAAGGARTAAELDSMFQRDVGPLLFEGPVYRGKRQQI
jgi:hypothetical protein